ncbi:Clec4e [Symbiodinium microadriaticum]|nr:Clec4e [Symbiodinium microadriaticum]
MSGWHEGGAGPSWEEHHAQLDALIAQLHAKAWIVAGGQAKDQPTTGRPSKGLAAEEALDVCYRDEGVTGSFSCLGIPQPHPPRLQSEPPSKPNPPADLEHDHLNRCTPLKNRLDAERSPHARRHKLPDVMPLLLGGRRPLGGILCTRSPSERVADAFCEGVPAEGFEKEVMVTAEKISRTLDTLQACWSSWSSGDAVEGSQNCPPAPATRSVGSAGRLSNRSMLQTPSESRGGWSDPEQSQLFQIPQKNLEQLRQEAARRQVLEALGKPPRSRGPRGFRGAEDWEGATQAEEAVQATRGARRSVGITLPFFQRSETALMCLVLQRWEAMVRQGDVTAMCRSAKKPVRCISRVLSQTTARSTRRGCREVWHAWCSQASSRAHRNLRRSPERRNGRGTESLAETLEPK